MTMRAERLRTIPATLAWGLVVGAVLGAVAGLAVDLHLDHTPVSSGSQIVLSDGAGISESTGDADTEDSYLTHRMSTYAQLAASDEVLAPAAAQVGTTVDALRPDVVVSAPDGTTVLDVLVRAATPDDAAAGTRAVDGALTAAITALETSPGQPTRVTARVTSGPSVPAARAAPPLGVVTALGAVTGLLVVALGAAVAASSVRRRAVRRLLDWFWSTPAS